MEKEKVFSPLNIIAAFVLSLFIFSFAVVFTLNFRPLYYMDIEKLDIPGATGYSRQEIRDNYDALINYNMLFYRGSLEFPSLPMSESGRIHFAEVKQIFDIVQIIAIASLAASIILCIVQARKKKYGFLLTGSVFSFAIPLLLGLLIAVNWNRFFFLFHKLFFNNDYWIFDSATDPVINILPDTFFMHCAVMIVCVVIIGSAACFISWLIKRRRGKANG